MRTGTLLLTALIAFGHAFPGLAQSDAPASTGYTITPGRAYSSLTFSLSTRDAENEDQLLRQVVSQSRYQYRFIGNGGYAIKDHLTVGFSLGYGRAEEEITVVDENGQNVTTKSLEQGLSFAPNIRSYIPISTGRLQILVQTELGITVGESLERIYREDDIDKVEGDFVELGLGVSPGMILFFDRHWAFETTVGIAGFRARKEEKEVNDKEDEKQRVVETSVDLRLNLLLLSLGVAYYF